MRYGSFLEDVYGNNFERTNNTVSKERTLSKERTTKCCNKCEQHAFDNRRLKQELFDQISSNSYNQIYYEQLHNQYEQLQREYEDYRNSVGNYRNQHYPIREDFRNMYGREGNDQQLLQIILFVLVSLFMIQLFECFCKRLNI